MNVIAEIVLLFGYIIYSIFSSFLRLITPQNAKSVRGKVAVVTGGGRGIGREIAVYLARLGAKVAVWDLDESLAEETSNIIKNLDGVSVSYKCDVTKPSEISDVAKKVRNDLEGQVEILVNNAGVLNCKNILRLSEKEIRRTMEVNVLAHFWTVQEFLQNMLSYNGGNILTIASMAAKGGHAFVTDYCSSKFAADGFSEALSAELSRMKKNGIQLTTVYPMFVNTNMLGDIYDRMETRDRFNPMLTVEEVAKAAVDGMLYNKRHVYIPSFMGPATTMLSLLPLKAQKACVDFLGIGFFERADKH